MLSSAHVLTMHAKQLLDVIDKIYMNYRHVNELILKVTAIITLAHTVRCARGASTENELVNMAVIHTYFVNHLLKVLSVHCQHMRG